MDVTLLLCDWAEAVQGKLYAQGIGWDRIVAQTPIAMSVALLMGVPYDQTNEAHKVTVALVTQDGQPYPFDEPAAFTIEFEVGRPPGMVPGQKQTVPFAGKVQGLVLEPGRYEWRLNVDGTDTDNVAAFTAFAQGG